MQNPNEFIQARKQGEGWRYVSSNYMRGYCLNTEDFRYSLVKITNGEIVKIQGQEFRRFPENHLNL